MQPDFCSGFVAIIGRPNAGKSTLLNSVIGRKVAITSDKPQTTRTRILGVLNRPNAQLVLVDTPGIHRPRHRLGEAMVNTARTALTEVEGIVLVVDATAGLPGSGDRYVAEQLAATKTPVVLALNKVDAVAGDQLPRLIAAHSALVAFHEVLPVSALRGDNLERLVAVLVDLLPPGPAYFPDGMVTDQPERQVVAEFVREQILRFTRDEVPHAVAVTVEEMTDRPNGLVYVRAVAYVERESQKGIIIGDGGRMLKQIGTSARQELERFFGTRFYIDLWVKVKTDWRNRSAALREFGFGRD